MQRLYKLITVQTLPNEFGNLSCLQDLLERLHKIISVQNPKSDTYPSQLAVAIEASRLLAMG